jgi:hypothetical protein
MINYVTLFTAKKLKESSAQLKYHQTAILINFSIGLIPNSKSKSSALIRFVLLGVPFVFPTMVVTLLLVRPIMNINFATLSY